MEPFTYLLINFFTVIICFIFSFDKRIRFDKHFLPFIKGCAIVALVFIAWDIWFTKVGVWWFNYRYLTGISIFNLPLEECMFFFFIPFSCVFTYYCLTKFFSLDWANAFNTIIVFVTTIVCGVVALLYYDRLYTLVTALCTLFTVIYLHFISKKDWIGEASLVYFILMLGFFPVNGILTGFGLEEPIVNYNPKEFLGVRMITIPIEDAVYGYSQFLWVLYFFKYYDSKLDSKEHIVSSN